MSKNLKTSNFEYDEAKLAELASEKAALTLKVDVLVAKHKFYSQQLKEVTEEYFKILGVNTNE